MPRLATWLLSGSVRLWAMIAAGVVMTAFAICLVWIIWQGGWPVESAKQQLWYLGTALLVSLGIICVVVVALTSTSLRAHGPAGVSLEVDSSDERNTKAVVTTTVETKPNA